MSCHWYDNAETAVFTPRDYQVELLAAAYERNTIVCLGHKSSKEFIALKLLQEYGRKCLSLQKFNLYLTTHGAPSMYTMIDHLTDFKVFQQANFDEPIDDLPNGFHVYMIQPETCLALLRADNLSLINVHLMILEDCHDTDVHRTLMSIFKEFYINLTCDKPKVLGLAGPLHSAGCSLGDLSAMLDILEDNIQCKTETASDIVTVLRYSSKPIERIIQCAPFERDELTYVLCDIICTHKAFLNNHRYDPFEIYNSVDFIDELKDIPDPKKEPLEFLDALLSVLHDMGPWAASRMAINMHNRIEKQKIKTPHERHYILLCLVNTAFFKIHTICEEVFSKIKNRLRIIETYSSPKVIRLMEILLQFKPDDFATDNKKIQKLDADLEKVDFQRLTRNLESSLQSLDNLVKQQNMSRSIVENLDPLVKQTLENLDISVDPQQRTLPLKTDSNRSLTRRQQMPVGRVRRKPYVRRARDNNDTADTLCAIIFCSASTTARVIFDLLMELGRADSKFKFLKALFLCDRVADPVLEPKEAEFEHRRQEEVLKRFRIHDCNVLVSTAVLEEGIDVPKCNLVVRWDTPCTYRSYVQCKGKARATPAYHMTLVAPKFDTTVSNMYTSEQLSDPSHRFLCHLRERVENDSLSDSTDAEGEDNSHHVIIGSAKGTVKILNPEVITNKPPTSSDIRLHEIQDEFPAIEGGNCSISATRCNGKVSTNGQNFKTKPKKSIKKAKFQERRSSPNYEIIDVAEVLASKKTNGLNIQSVNSPPQKDLPIPEGNVCDQLNNRNPTSVGESADLEGVNQPGIDPSGIIEILAVRTHRTSTLSEESGGSQEALSDSVSAGVLGSKPDISDAKTPPSVTGCSSKTTSTMESSDESCTVNSNGQATLINREDRMGDDDKKRKKKRCKKREKIPENCDETGCYARNDESHPASGTCQLDFTANMERMEQETNVIVEQLANYRQIEKILLQHCANTEPAEMEQHLADEFTACIEPYKPLANLLTAPSVDLSTSIALINKYCSKLPSDTFTKLTALWRCAISFRNDVPVFQYTIRLPINSPLKFDIVGIPMPTKILARRMAALQACIKLHQSGELDDHLQPIGKEGFRAIEPDWENFELEEQDEKIVVDNIEPRPGTTKRRQYYYKRIASEFCNCRPTDSTPCYLYLLDLRLQCPIPEEQNTRGRRIYPPEDAQQGFGILTLKKIPKISAFPIFTRSGEVKVSIELSKERIVLTKDQISCINTFLNYTFTNVLRLQKFLMLFDPDSTENCIFIVPTIKTPKGKVIDWDFLKVIEENSNMMPEAVPESERLATEFDANRFKDAVVMPWYRNQDQPQYFYVAEICPHLTPLSCFPGENYNTFKHYYFLKYSLEIQNSSQPLLDVDHTSARLNFLTPRYVNRKGVALPTSSEETKRAKRENLEQKQILVPELCTVHPFPASLWRTAVCLPCILYRINGLLLADDIRKKVSSDIGLGEQEVSEDFEWPMLDFGWSLSEVLKKSRENKAKALETLQTGANATKAQVEKSGNGKDAVDSSVADLKTEKSANEIVVEGEKQLQDNDFIEIGTWSNDMANDISSKPSDEDEDEYLKYLPSNVSFCSKDISIGSPSRWNQDNSEWGSNSFPIGNRDAQSNSHRFSYYDSDDSLASNYEPSPTQYSSDDCDEEEPGLKRIAFTSRNEAETIETEQEIEKHRKQLSIIQATNANESDYQKTKNLLVGYNFVDIRNEMTKALDTSNSQFRESLSQLKAEISESGMLVKFDEPIVLPRKEEETKSEVAAHVDIETLYKMVPYASKEDIIAKIRSESKVLSVQTIEEMNRIYMESHPLERFTIEGTGDVFDNFNDKQNLNILNERKIFWKRVQLNYEEPHQEEALKVVERTIPDDRTVSTASQPLKFVNSTKSERFSFDYQPDLRGHPGPSPSIILQALTMSNANDGINLERLETIGDSFLKYAITTYLYITYENVHEGKLSHLRSKQVANLNLYRLGRRKMLGEYMIATKFEPHDNWLPPCYYVPKELEKALIEAKIPPHHWKLVDLPNIKALSSAEICELVRRKADQLGLMGDELPEVEHCAQGEEIGDASDFTCFIPYNLVTQHSIPDKSVADCVEALIGAYLIECGSRGALLFMAWLGIRVLPVERKPFDPSAPKVVGSTRPDADNMVTIYGDWTPPKSPLLRYFPNADTELERMLDGFDELETTLGYKFRDRSYLLQAMTHASYSPNRLTDCYQRLEFLGDAVLDYLITRHLYEDPRQHSPGALTDLRSALVNNTIFASLAVRHGFHKYFRHLSPGLNEVIDRFVRIQTENGHVISEEYYLLSEEECDDAEDVEVPKALGDVFESIAGAIFLDSNMSLDVVWQVYSNMMKPEIEQFSNSVPKSPIRELLELEPETAKFGKPEKLADGRRVRVSVEVFSKGTFRGIGRNYRIAKCTAAKCALRQLKKQGLIAKKD